MTMVVYTPAGDGPGPITVDPDPYGGAVVHGAYGAAGVAASPHRTVTSHVHLALTWSQPVPYQVHATFTHAGHGGVRHWDLARCLLRNGGGTGDVHVLPGNEQTTTWLHLATPHAQGAIAVDTSWLTEFLTATEELVSPAYEWDAVDVPGTVSELDKRRGV